MQQQTINQAFADASPMNRFAASYQSQVVTDGISSAWDYGQDALSAMVSGFGSLGDFATSAYGSAAGDVYSAGMDVAGGIDSAIPRLGVPEQSELFWNSDAAGWDGIDGNVAALQDASAGSQTPIRVGNVEYTRDELAQARMQQQIDAWSSWSPMDRLSANLATSMVRQAAAWRIAAVAAPAVDRLFAARQELLDLDDSDMYLIGGDGLKQMLVGPKQKEIDVLTNQVSVYQQIFNRLGGETMTAPSGSYTYGSDHYETGGMGFDAITRYISMNGRVFGPCPYPTGDELFAIRGLSNAIFADTTTAYAAGVVQGVGVLGSVVSAPRTAVIGGRTFAIESDLGGVIRLVDSESGTYISGQVAGQTLTNIDVKVAEALQRQGLSKQLYQQLVSEAGNIDSITGELTGLNAQRLMELEAELPSTAAAVRLTPAARARAGAGFTVHSYDEATGVLTSMRPPAR